MKAPATIDGFLAGLSEDKQAALQKLRKAIRSAAPGAEECIAYGVPSFRIDGKYFLSFGAGANHCAFYPGAAAIATHRAELSGHDTSKGTIRFQPKPGLPAALVKKLVKVRMGAMRPVKPRKAR